MLRIDGERKRQGYFKTWTVDRGLDHGLDYGPNSVASSSIYFTILAFAMCSYSLVCNHKELYTVLRKRNNGTRGVVEIAIQHKAYSQSASVRHAPNLFTLPELPVQ